MHHHDEYIADLDYMRNSLIRQALDLLSASFDLDCHSNRRKQLTPEQVKQRLVDTYPESFVDVTDLTGTHDHYSVYIASDVFKGMSRIQRHKHVMAAFDSELKSGEVHALTIRTDEKNKEENS